MMSKITITENMLAVLITLLSIFTAYAAFQAARIDSSSTDNYFLAQTELVDSNAAVTNATLILQRDFRLLDEYDVRLELEPEIAAGYLTLLSPEAYESYERSGELDQAYYDAAYVGVDEFMDEYDVLFTQAAHDSNRAVSYQLTVLILAVGLSFAAWGSLADERSQTRRIYFVMGVIAFVGGIAQMLTIAPPL